MSQAFDDECVTRHAAADERQAAGGGFHPVMRGDAVFDENGDAVQGRARTVRASLVVERLRDVQGVRVRFDHGVKRMGALPIDRIDTARVPTNEIDGRVPTAR